MENAIILHNVAPKELAELIKKVIKNELDEFRKSFSAKNCNELLTRNEACSLLKIIKTSLWKWTKTRK